MKVIEPVSCGRAAAAIPVQTSAASVAQIATYFFMTPSSLVVVIPTEPVAPNEVAPPKPLRCFGSGRRGGLAAVGAILFLCHAEVKRCAPSVITGDCTR